MAHVLFIRPCYEFLTRNLVSASNLIINRLDISNSPTTFCDLLGSDATKQNVEAELTDRVNFVAFLGHGNASYLATRGRANVREKVIELNNCHYLKNKVVYAVACDSAKILGREAVNTGAKAYIGYSGPVSLILGSTESIFYGSLNHFIYTLTVPQLAAAKTLCGDAFDELWRAHDAIVEHYESGLGANDYNRPFYLPNAKANLKWLTFLGDRTATV